jgi:hypothetical protein
MMVLFDYVYYKASDFYSRSDPNGAGISGLAVLTTVQFLNLLSAYMASFTFFHTKPYLNKGYVLLFMAVLLVLNGIRYNKRNYPILKERWAGESESRKGRNNLLVISYIMISLFVPVSLAFCL